MLGLKLNHFSKNLSRKATHKNGFISNVFSHEVLQNLSCEECSSKMRRIFLRFLWPKIGFHCSVQLHFVVHLQLCWWKLHYYPKTPCLWKGVPRPTPFFSLISKISFEGHLQNLHKNPLGFKTWMEVVRQILMMLEISSVRGFLQSSFKCLWGVIDKIR